MGQISLQQIAGQFEGVFREAFEGPPEGFAYFSDQGEDAGLLPLLSRLSAEEASKPIDGSTIAGQVQHLTFSLHASIGLLCQDGGRPNWAESWSVDQVDEEGWKGLVGALEAVYGRFTSAVETRAFESEMAVGIVLGNVAHLAYHLGLIRQKARQVRAGGVA